MKINSILIIFLFLSIELFAQENNSILDESIPGMITDRPDATESPKTV
ncbi:MAG: hypothetical protein ACI93N_000599, partial [Flavobacteriaceae bacterium]